MVLGCHIENKNPCGKQSFNKEAKLGDRHQTHNIKVKDLCKYECRKHMILVRSYLFSYSSYYSLKKYDLHKTFSSRRVKKGDLN